jgi:hypothetical protein
MADYGCSRLERFELEKEKLKPLTVPPYELFEWKMAKVHADSCIELKGSVYSVPHAFIGQMVQVKFSDKLVIILDESASKTLASHGRQRKYQHSITPEHLPPHKTQLSSFNVRRVQKFADAVGPNTRTYVDWQFSKEDHPLRALRRMLGLIRFFDTKHPSKDAMEYAATVSRQFDRLGLQYFQNCAANFHHDGGRLHLVTPPLREMSHIHVRSPLGE